MVASSRMRILVDYRPALRERTGVGEYVHELVRAYTQLPEASSDSVRLFTSSWKDRPSPGLGADLGVEVVDRRIPVRALNYLWHRAEWPPAEALAGDVDVVLASEALSRLLAACRGSGGVVVCDIDGVVHAGRPGLAPQLVWTAEHTNPRGVTGTLRAALAGARDVVEWEQRVRAASAATPDSDAAFGGASPAR